ncbi:MAG TPA: hypothetical protein VHP81_12920 [Lachnospiraceae bacterium]|nr:hypothetical protein [Lachnospiraceae bacterium]
MIRLSDMDKGGEEISLARAYELGKPELARQYFEFWNEESTKRTREEYRDVVEENLYKLYKAFFQPYNMEPLVDEQFMGYAGKEVRALNKVAPYLVTQKQLPYTIQDISTMEDYLSGKGFSPSIPRDERKTLYNFYPSVDINPEKVLHLTEKYEKDLNRFLGTRDPSLMSDTRKETESERAERERRKLFIQNYIPVLYGHWGGYWHLSTHPEVGLIILDRNLDRAVVEYRIGYNFGFAEYRISNGNWEFVRATMNGVE